MAENFEQDLLRETLSRVLQDHPESLREQFEGLGLLELIDGTDGEAVTAARSGAMAVHVELGRALGSVPYLQCAAARAFLLALGLAPRAGWCSLLLDQQSFSWTLSPGPALLAFAGQVDEFLVFDSGELCAVPAASLGGTALGVVDPTFPLSTVDAPGTGEVIAKLSVEQVAGALQVAESFARAALCAEMLGSSQKCLDIALEHIRLREQFGQAIGTMQAVQHKAADMAIRMEGMRGFVAAMGRDGDDRTAAMAKAYVSDGARFVAETCMQLHGGMGFTWECSVHHHLRHAHRCGQLLGAPTTLRAQHIGGL